MSDSRIQFDDGIHPVVPQGGGVHRLRSREVTGVGSIRSPHQVRRAKGEEFDTESMTNIEDRDYKPKQVGGSSYLSNDVVLISVVLYWLAIVMASISVNRSYLRRHWYQPPICVLLYVHRRSQL
jgi:hypothetical protein